MIILLVVCSFPNIKAQDTIEYSKEKHLANAVDSLLIDKDISHWSVRTMLSYKDNKFRLSNNENSLFYTPNNGTSAGIGFATSKLLLDIGINIKSNKENQTDRFDLQSSLLIKRGILAFQIQNYKGYNITIKSIADEDIFREDIRSFSTALSYMHIFKSDLKTLSGIYSGVSKNYKNTGSFLAGMYSNYQQIDADSSIVPDSYKALFNEEAQIKELKKISFGVAAGYAYFLNLPANMFILLKLTPGVGLSFTSITAENQSYKPSDHWDLYLYANITIGYNGSRFYIELSDENNWNFSSIDYGNTGLMNTTKFKLAFGWKIRAKSP